MVIEFQKKPEIDIFARPNGFGKSIFTQLLKQPMACIYDLTDIFNVEKT